MARAFAALPQSHQDFFDGMVADERAKDAKDKRIAALRTMGDFQALDLILKDARRGETIFDLDVRAVARGLVEAGFERRKPDEPAPCSVELTLNGRPFEGVRESNCICTVTGNGDDLSRLVGALQAGRRLVGCHWGE